MKINKIYNMDAYEGMQQLPDNSIDLVITDPPYQISCKDPTGAGFIKKENKRHLINIKKSFGVEFDPLQLLEQLQRVTKKFNAYIFTNKNLLYEYIKFARDNDYVFDILLWLKPNPVPINNAHYLCDKEYIVYIRERGVMFNSKLDYENYYTYQSIAIGSKAKYNHPTIKPIKLLINPIKISSNEGDVILDPFMGSGTTAVAAKQLKRKYIGFEIDPEYVKIIKQRLAQQVL